MSLTTCTTNYYYGNMYGGRRAHKREGMRDECGSV